MIKRSARCLIDQGAKNVFFIRLEEAFVAALGARFVAGLLGIEVVLTGGATQNFTAFCDAYFLDDRFWCFHFRHTGNVLTIKINDIARFSVRCTSGKIV